MHTSDGYLSICLLGTGGGTRSCCTSVREHPVYNRIPLTWRPSTTNHLRTSHVFTTVHSGLTWATHCYVPPPPAVVTAYTFPVGFVLDLSSRGAAPCLGPFLAISLEVAQLATDMATLSSCNSLVHPLWWIHLSCGLSQLPGLKIVLSQLSCLITRGFFPLAHPDPHLLRQHHQQLLQHDYVNGSFYCVIVLQPLPSRSRSCVTSSWGVSLCSCFTC